MRKLGQIALKIGAKAEPYEEAFSLIPEGPRDAKDAQREAIYRFGEAVIAGSDEYRAVSAILKRERPRVEGLKAGAPIIPDGADLLDGGEFRHRSLGAQLHAGSRSPRDGEDVSVRSRHCRSACPGSTHWRGVELP